MKKLKFILAFFCILFFNSYAYAAETEYSLKHDFPLHFNTNLNERINNKNIYFLSRYYTNPEFSAESEINQKTIFNFTEQTSLISEAQKDSEDALGYAIENYFNRDPLWQRFRQIITGIETLEIQKEKRTGKIKIKLPSPRRQLDTYDEEIRKLKTEKDSLSDDTPQTMIKKLGIEKQIQQIIYEAAEAKPLQIKLGVKFSSTTLRISEYKNIGFRPEPFLSMGSQQTKTRFFYRHILPLENLRKLGKKETGVSFESNFFNSRVSGSFNYLRQLQDNSSQLEINLRSLAMTALNLTLTHRYNFESKMNEDQINFLKILSPRLALNFNDSYNWRNKNNQANIVLTYQF